MGGLGVRSGQHHAALRRFLRKQNISKDERRRMEALGVWQQRMLGIFAIQQVEKPLALPTETALFQSKTIINGNM